MACLDTESGSLQGKYLGTQLSFFPLILLTDSMIVCLILLADSLEREAGDLCRASAMV